MRSFFQKIGFLSALVLVLAFPQATLADNVGGNASVYGNNNGVLGGNINLYGNTGTGNVYGNNTGNWNIGSLSFLGLPRGSVSGIVMTILGWLLMMFGFIAILGFVISGIMYIISTGDDDLSKRAKKGMVNSIIGIIVGLSGLVLLQFINNMLEGQGSVNY